MGALPDKSLLALGLSGLGDVADFLFSMHGLNFINLWKIYFIQNNLTITAGR